MNALVDPKTLATAETEDSWTVAGRPFARA
jgi:hypothetical protein